MNINTYSVVEKFLLLESRREGRRFSCWEKLAKFAFLKDVENGGEKAKVWLPANFDASAVINRIDFLEYIIWMWLSKCNTVYLYGISSIKDREKREISSSSWFWEPLHVTFNRLGYFTIYCIFFSSLSFRYRLYFLIWGRSFSISSLSLLISSSKRV